MFGKYNNQFFLKLQKYKKYQKYFEFSSRDKNNKLTKFL